ncbi:integrase [Rhodococcus sp. SRB_17]|uniref:tyrosine-type recombinase/integrase n=1 Tax=Acidovorax sp. SRB_24 TaxID=1962700 RepID=UPI00145F4AEB|nr:tyrosine-type recombinase/integrase [Acidovorax sp. SRB_24]NMM77059.1 integrase [Acidovorax sp. SRB_24]NMM84709.1 integrase [Rhodococcus sp. SRB_17]
MFTPLLQKVPALLPSALSDVTRNAVHELMREGESLNTLASYRAALRYWAAWYGLRYGVQIQLPLPTACVLQFVVDHAQRATAQGLASELPDSIDDALVAGGYKGKPGPMAHSTLVHRIAVMSKAHQLRGLSNPCHDVQVRELLSRTRKAYAKRGALPRKKAALTKDPLQALLETCDDTLRGKRDRALLLFAWASGGRRRSEVAGAQMEQLRRIGPAEFVYTLAHSKTNQAGRDLPENNKPVLGPAGDALQDWLLSSGIAQGPIFRRILKGGHLGGPMSPAAVRTIVKARCALAGVEGDFSAHSLRSGFVTEAGRQNVSLADTMALTGHHSIPTVMGYFRAEATILNKGARLLDGSE